MEIIIKKGGKVKSFSIKNLNISLDDLYYKIFFYIQQLMKFGNVKLICLKEDNNGKKKINKR